MIGDPMAAPSLLDSLCLIPSGNPMPTRPSEIIPRRILAIQSGLAILAVVIGASESVEIVRWALYLGRLLLPIVIASWGLFLVNVIIFVVAFCGRVCFPSTEATFLDDGYVLLRRFAIVIASLILAVVAFVGMTPAFM